MTPEQQSQMLRRLNDVTKIHECNVCGQDQWGISDKLFKLQEIPINEHGVDVRISSPIIMVVAVATCVQCGNIRMFDLVDLGLIDQSGGWIGE